MQSQPLRRSSALQRHGRATLLYAVAALVLVQAGLRLGIDWCWPELRDPTFEIKAQRLARLIARCPRPPVTILMVGSSVTSNLFKAKDLEVLLARQLDRPAVVLNMSSHGAGPLTELVWTRRLLERGIRPDLLCIEVSPFLYNYPDAPVDAKHFPASMLSQSDLGVVQRYSAAADLRRTWGLDCWLPAYRHRLTMLNYLAHPLVPCEDQIPTWGGAIDDRFWAALPPRQPDDLRQHLHQVKAQFGPELKRFAPGPSSLQAFEELLQLLHREGIRATVVLTPQGRTMRSLYPAEALQRFVTRLSQLTRQYDGAFLNAFDWLEEDKFGDSIHATVAGAELFSTRLAGEVLLPELTRSLSRRRPGDKE
jgi:hypothetical protein